MKHVKTIIYNHKNHPMDTPTVLWLGAMNWWTIGFGVSMAMADAFVRYNPIAPKKD